MKSSELHRRVKRNGWTHIRTEGSHYIYEKDGRTYLCHSTDQRKLEKGCAAKYLKNWDCKNTTNNH